MSITNGPVFEETHGCDVFPGKWGYLEVGHYHSFDHVLLRTGLLNFILPSNMKSRFAHGA